MARRSWFCRPRAGRGMERFRLRASVFLSDQKDTKESFGNQGFQNLPFGALGRCSLSHRRGHGRLGSTTFRCRWAGGGDWFLFLPPARRGSDFWDLSEGASPFPTGVRSARHLTGCRAGARPRRTVLCRVPVHSLRRGAYHAPAVPGLQELRRGAQCAPAGAGPQKFRRGRCLIGPPKQAYGTCAGAAFKPPNPS